jgi:hypothetical protein
MSKEQHDMTMLWRKNGWIDTFFVILLVLSKGHMNENITDRLLSFFWMASIDLSVYDADKA